MPFSIFIALYNRYATNINYYVCHRILQTLENYEKKIESSPPSAEIEKEKPAWKRLWENEKFGKNLLLYACSHGSVDSVKHLVGLNYVDKRYFACSYCVRPFLVLVLCVWEGSSKGHI